MAMNRGEQKVHTDVITAKFQTYGAMNFEYSTIGILALSKIIHEAVFLCWRVVRRVLESEHCLRCRAACVGILRHQLSQITEMSARSVT